MLAGRRKLQLHARACRLRAKIYRAQLQRRQAGQAQIHAAALDHQQRVVGELPQHARSRARRRPVCRHGVARLSTGGSWRQIEANVCIGCGERGHLDTTAQERQEAQSSLEAAHARVQHAGDIHKRLFDQPIRGRQQPKIQLVPHNRAADQHRQALLQLRADAGLVHQDRQGEHQSQRHERKPPRGEEENAGRPAPRIAHQRKFLNAGTVQNGATAMATAHRESTKPVR